MTRPMKPIRSIKETNKKIPTIKKAVTKKVNAYAFLEEPKVIPKDNTRLVTQAFVVVAIMAVLITSTLISIVMVEWFCK